MKRLVLFVEGKTERVFVEKLVRLMVEEKKLTFAVYSAAGGGGGQRRINTLIYKTRHDATQEFHVQIVESGNDERVASVRRESAQFFGTLGGKPTS